MPIHVTQLTAPRKPAPRESYLPYSGVPQDLNSTYYAIAESCQRKSLLHKSTAAAALKHQPPGTTSRHTSPACIMNSALLHLMEPLLPSSLAKGHHRQPSLAASRSATFTGSLRATAHQVRPHCPQPHPLHYVSTTVNLLHLQISCHSRKLQIAVAYASLVFMDTSQRYSRDFAT